HTLLFLCSPHPPHLHSFPTRRSSDLHHAADTVHAASAFFLSHEEHEDSTDRNRHPWRDRNGRPAVHCSALEPSVVPRRMARRERSEEHTSELQSRFDLVCRLLLEKKK